MAGHAQSKFIMTECSKTQIRLTRLISFLYPLFWCLLSWTLIVLPDAQQALWCPNSMNRQRFGYSRGLCNLILCQFSQENNKFIFYHHEVLTARQETIPWIYCLIYYQHYSKTRQTTRKSTNVSDTCRWLVDRSTVPESPVGGTTFRGSTSEIVM